MPSSGEQTEVLEMHCTLLQTGYEGEDQGGDEICRTAHALPASHLVRCALPDREITYARPSEIAKQRPPICPYVLMRLLYALMDYAAFIWYKYF